MSEQPMPNDLSAPAGVERPNRGSIGEFGQFKPDPAGKLYQVSDIDPVLEAQADEIARLRAQLDAKPASLPHTLRANLESALSAFNAARAEDGWEPVTLVIPPVDKPQPAEGREQAFKAWWAEYMPVRTIGRHQDNFIQCAYAAWNASADIADCAKPQPAGLPYTLEECADMIEGEADRSMYPLRHKVLRDVVTSLRGMAK